MTIGGAAATRAVRGGNSNTRQLNSEIWYVAENTLTSGDIVMTESGNNANYRALDLYRMGGVTTTPHATAGNESLTDLSLAVDAGGFAVALSTNQQSTAIPTLTGITNDVAVSVGARHGAQFGAQIIGASGTLTIGSDMGATNGACKCAASWSP